MEHPDYILVNEFYNIKESGKKVKLLITDGQVLYGYPIIHYDVYEDEENGIEDGYGFSFKTAPESANVPWIRGLPSFGCDFYMLESFEVLD